MLLINGKTRDEFVASGGERAKAFNDHINKAIDTIVGRKQNIILRTHPTKIRHITDENNMPVQAHSAGRRSLNTKPYVFKGSVYKISFVSSGQFKDDKGNIKKEWVDYNGATMVFDNKKQAEELFFRTCVLSRCAYVGFLKEFQQERHGSLEYEVYDPQTEKALNVEKEAKKAKVYQVLYGSTTVIKEELEIIASAFDIKNIDKIDVDDLKVLIKNILIRKDGSLVMEKYEIFEDALRERVVAETKYLIRKAIADGIVIQDKTGGKSPKDAWYTTNADKSKDAYLVTIAPEHKDNQEQTLIDYVLKNKEKREQLIDFINSNGKVPYAGARKGAKNTNIEITDVK